GMMLCQTRRYELPFGLDGLAGTSGQQGNQCEGHEGCEALAHGHDRVGDFKVPATMPALAPMIKFNRTKCDDSTAAKRLAHPPQPGGPCMSRGTPPRRPARQVVDSAGTAATAASVAPATGSDSPVPPASNPAAARAASA